MADPAGIVGFVLRSTKPTKSILIPIDLEIDRVERIDSTRLKIDRLDRSTRL